MSEAVYNEIKKFHPGDYVALAGSPLFVKLRAIDLTHDEVIVEWENQVKTFQEMTITEFLNKIETAS